MKKTTNSLVSTLLLCFMVSCSLFESEDPKPKEDPARALDLEVQLVADSLKPSDLLTLQIISGDQPEQDSVQASIGSSKLSLFVTDTLTLVGRVPPDIPGGQHEIQSADFRNSVRVSILEGTYIGDPDKYLADLIASFTKEIKDNFDSIDDPVRYNYFVRQINEIEQQFNGLTTEERVLLSTIIANRSQELNELEAALTDYETEVAGGRTAACGFSCRLLSVGAIAAIAAAVPTAALAGVAVGTVAIVADKYLKLNLDAKLTRYKDLAVDYFSDGDFWPHDETITEVFNYADRKLFNKSSGGGRRAGSKLIVVERRPMEVEFYPTYRAFNESDAHSENPLVAQLVSSHLAIGSYWSENMPEEAGDFFQLTPKHEQRTARNPDGLRVEVISSSDGFDRINITNQEGVPNDYKVTFDSEDDSDQELTFKVIYEEDGEVAYEEVITADFWSLDYEAWQEERSGDELKLYNYLLGNGMVETELTIQAMQYTRQHINQIEIKDNIGLSVLGGLNIFKYLHLIDIRNNPLPSLDLSNLTTNYYFSLYIENCPLGWANLGGQAFYSLSFQGTNLSSLDVNDLDLLYVNLYNNPLLNSLSGVNTAKLHMGGRGIRIFLHSNQISSVSWANPLIREIAIINEPVTSVDIGQCKRLKQLGIEEAPGLTSLHLDNIDSLYSVSIQKTGIANFTISDCPELINLTVRESKLSSLSLTNFPKLEMLSVRSNILTHVALEQVGSVELLYLDNNKLQALDICGLGKLLYADVTFNEFSENSLQTIINCHGGDVINYNCTSYVEDECPE